MRIQLIAPLFILLLFFTQELSSQQVFTESDTLRGMLSPARTCFDVEFYHLNIKIDPEKKYLDGYVDMEFKAVEDFLTLQVDLFANMKMDKIVRLDNDQELKFKRRFNAVFVNMGEEIKKGAVKKIRMYYSGHPTVAMRAPWDGGFVFDKDAKGRHWIGVACEGDGASLWWPNKDHLSDEPEKMNISIAVPNGLTCVSNGNLAGTEELKDDYTRFDWKVSYPINNYNVTVNIAEYAHFRDIYTADDKTTLDLDFYVLDYNLEKAKKHFKQVQPTLNCFEHYFGKYPFWNDGYALVETPYLGMEHQGAIAYGNQYTRGYLGGMIPHDMDFDYIIVHETGHEYFGNSISCYDHAEMWLHESFTTYMEALFVECTRGYQDAMRYLHYQRAFVQNEEAIIGPMDVNWTKWQSSDHYFKGAIMLNTLRHCINDDELWFKILREFHEKNKITNLRSEDFYAFVKEYTGRDYDKFFQQYLEYPALPIFIYDVKKKKGEYQLKFKWEADVESFDMPLGISLDGKKTIIYPTADWQKISLDIKKESDFKILDKLFHIVVEPCD